MWIFLECVIIANNLTLFKVCVIGIMPPKRGCRTTRAVSSSFLSTFDRTKFVTKRVSENFKTILTKKVNQEWGFNLLLEAHLDIKRQIYQWGWQQFILEPKKYAVLSVVREFYANASKHKGFIATFRGKKLRLNVDFINTLHNIP